MVIEHIFITTMESPEALTAASNLLREGGFAVLNNGAFQMGGWTDLEVNRGKKNVARAKDVTECPQQVRLEWDRGRVTVAASITTRPRHTKAFAWSRKIGGVAFPPSKVPKKERAYADLLTVITRSVELLLAQRRSQEEARREWAAVETQMKADSRRTRRRNAILGFSILGIFIGLLILIAVKSNA